uniref:Uncharacterized protein n=1 Tax=Oryza sativa subsp. japonica TaxID=39947 RepID=Q69JG1_ORYSJ|nr:hypothetical protein [Oryza sativa Japonica Group]BAD34367.1 hypothetical protein [Oryza sativa Japonica Group]
MSRFKPRIGFFMGRRGWTGEETKELQYAGTIARVCNKAVKAASDAESGGVHLSGGSAMTLENKQQLFCFFILQAFKT